MKRRLDKNLTRRAVLLLFVQQCAVCGFIARSACGFDIGGRWSATQLDGGGLQRGDPTNLRWSIVPDGHSYDRSANSNLIQFLDDGWNVPAAQRTPDFTNRPWWTVINNAYAQYSRVAGITFHYVAEQDANGVSTNAFGDIRIGGENIDGTPGGALADNVYPDGGDMRIDTTREANGSVGGYFSTEPGLRNLVIHESGHGVGLGHAQPVNNSMHAVMEGGLRTDIWGLQFDDVYALNRQYGDPLERNGGNDVFARATSLGTFGATGGISLGMDAGDTVVNQFDDDWLGIDGLNDFDWFKFTVAGDCFADIRLTPVGPSYTTVENGSFNASQQNDLVLQAFSTSPTLSLKTTKDAGGLGESELIGALHLTAAGEYAIRVRGKQDFNQFYQLDLTLSASPTPGMSADLNLDGLADREDWSLFVSNAGMSSTGLSQQDQFMHGDLNYDGLNDYRDFKLFKSAYELANGSAAFANLLQVPEPSAQACLGLAATCLAMWKKTRRPPIEKCDDVAAS